MAKVESKHFVKKRIASRESCGSTRIQHTITARFCPHKKALRAKGARRVQPLRIWTEKKLTEKNSMVAVFRSMERGLTISVSQEKKVSLRFRLWTSRPRAQIIFVSRSRALMSAYVRISKIRTFARQGPRDLETKIISGRGRVVHERNRRFTGSFHFSACRRCRDLVCRTATHG